MKLHLSIWFCSLLFSACSPPQNSKSLTEKQQKDIAIETIGEKHSYASESTDIKDIINKKQQTNSGNYFMVSAPPLSDTGKIIWVMIR